MINWTNIRSNRFNKDRPPEWPQGVFGISIDGTSLFGIDEKTGRLYWDGKEVVLRRAFLLGTPERWIASIAATGTFGSFLVNFFNLGHTTMHWW